MSEVRPFRRPVWNLIPVALPFGEYTPRTLARMQEAVDYMALRGSQFGHLGFLIVTLAASAQVGNEAIDPSGTAMVD